MKNVGSIIKQHLEDKGGGWAIDLTTARSGKGTLWDHFGTSLVPLWDHCEQNLEKTAKVTILKLCSKILLTYENDHLGFYISID